MPNSTRERDGTPQSLPAVRCQRSRIRIERGREPTGDSHQTEALAGQVRVWWASDRRPDWTAWIPTAQIARVLTNDTAQEEETDKQGDHDEQKRHAKKEVRATMRAGHRSNIGRLREIGHPSREGRLSRQPGPASTHKSASKALPRRGRSTPTYCPDSRVRYARLGARWPCSKTPSRLRVVRTTNRSRPIRRRSERT